MVTFECTNKDCDNANVSYNFLGNPETALCGGCKEHLIGTDLREDPKVPSMIVDDTND
jgi:hypothetical protein